ncbi:MAG TPA: hypothetical protein VFF52_01645 [Isosphaeraceae bacterium]|nr:hypothetical protein [Isosphaeraceae bacterium]
MMDDTRLGLTRATPGRQQFQTTCWSQVLAVRDGPSTAARAAPAALCDGYWYPRYDLPEYEHEQHSE